MAHSAYDAASKSMQKHIVFLMFTPKHSVLLSKIDVLGFLEQPGDPNDDINFGQPNNIQKPYVFDTFCLPPQSVTRKAEFTSRRFVYTGSEFFPKHSASRRQEESSQLSLIHI